MSSRKTVFSDDFHVSGLSNWKTEQHVPDGYNDFVIRDNALAFLDAGNRLLPRIPILKDLIIKSCFEADWHANGRCFSINFFIDYNPHQRQGTLITLNSDGKELAVYLKCEDKEIHKKIDENFLAQIIASGIVSLELRAGSQTLSLWMDKKRVFSHKIKRTPGLVALSRGVFVGELRMMSFAIMSSDQLVKKLVLDHFKLPFAPLNGMDDPIVWTVSAWRVANIMKLRVELSGGCVDRPCLSWFPYHGRYIEELSAPYLRLESGDKSVELKLTEKKLTLCHDPQKFFYLLGPEKPEWPLKRDFYIADSDIGNSLLVLGYEGYNSRAINKHQAAGNYETVYRAKDGKMLYSGEALRSDMTAIELHSAEDKAICRKIPSSIHDYERALQFAQNNHYFEEDEPCRFKFRIYSRTAAATDELRVEYRLEDAFFTPQQKYSTVKMETKIDVPFADALVWESEEINFPELKPGVYHIRFQLWWGQHELLQEKCRAFEIFSQNQSGPEASSLPVLFSMPTEIMGAETDYFDPWKVDCVDVSHYISIGVSVMPHLARKKRLWELYQIYHRQWYLYMTSRSMQDWNLEHNRDLAKHCDYIETPHDLRAVCLVRLSCRYFYRSAILEALYEFARQNDFSVKIIKDCLDNKELLPMTTFTELIETHFYNWLDFFSVRYLESIRNKKLQVASINPRTRFASGGPVAVYASAYKTAHSVRYLLGGQPSREINDIYDGFLIFEDYPHACRYSINRGPVLTADIKLKYPDWHIYPEMYSPFGEPCPDAAVARAWPSVGMWGDDFPVNSSMKRVLEYVYACVWHDGNSFKYWRDYGFHTRVWERARYEALMKLWGFVNETVPERPLKSNVFISSEECCRKHKVYYDEYHGANYDAVGDMFNTAEEAIPYVYEMSRSAGQNAGFIADFNALSVLDADDIDILVLPPLTAVSPEILSNIRHLHEQGVSLLAFEEVAGLEDLFGVKADSVCQVNNIAVNQKLPNNPLLKLSELKEYTEHRACKGKYRSVDADVLLAGEIPILFMNQTCHGLAALFNVPPTTVRRQDQPHRVSFGRDSISELINESIRILLRHLSCPAVETDAGKLIGFKDTTGNTHLIIEEDAHPFPARCINPLVAVNLPGLTPEKFSCSKEFTLVSCSPDSAKIRLVLEPDEFAVISINQEL